MLGSCAPQPVAGAPRVAIRDLKELSTPLPRPYDDTADAASVKARLDAAFARASTEHKRVIVDLGGNWCGWCRMLASVMERPEVKPFINANFEVVPVTVSTTQGGEVHNSEVIDRFHADKIDGVPWLIVAEPDGRVVSSSSEVTDDDHDTPQTMVNWLAEHAPKRR